MEGQAVFVRRARESTIHHATMLRAQPALCGDFSRLRTKQLQQSFPLNKGGMGLDDDCAFRKVVHSDGNMAGCQAGFGLYHIVGTVLGVQYVIV